MDSTRRGKVRLRMSRDLQTHGLMAVTFAPIVQRLPDALSKTVPIW